MGAKGWVHYLCFDAYFEDALAKMRSATGLGATYALFTAVNEYFYEKGYMGQKGYDYHKARYSQTLVDELEKKVDVQIRSANLAIQEKERELKALGATRQVAYSEMPLEELQKIYDKYVKNPGKHYAALQVLAFELKKRGASVEG